MRKVKKIVIVCLSMIMAVCMFTACGGSDDTISVISREEGSGTRGAFVELFGIEQKDADGNKVDHTVETAEITNSTSVMMQTVAGNESAIGYISLGSLDDTVKALKVDGVEASIDNVKSGDYKVSRPFNIVVKEDLSDAAKDFVDYIMSAEGQSIVESEGYVSQENTGVFQGGKAKGEVTVSGSSSVTPVMQKLAEEYQKVNGNVTVSVQQSDSTTGVTDAINGISDIGMASRAVTDEEIAQGVTGTAIALDGIAVIANLNCAVEDISSETVLGIYTGEITTWAEVE